MLAYGIIFCGTLHGSPSPLNLLRPYDRLKNSMIHRGIYLLNELCVLFVQQRWVFSHYALHISSPPRLRVFGNRLSMMRWRVHCVWLLCCGIPLTCKVGTHIVLMLIDMCRVDSIKIRRGKITDVVIINRTKDVVCVWALRSPLNSCAKRREFVGQWALWGSLAARNKHNTI